MAVKTPYLAAENSAMDRRSRGLHRFLVSSPVLLLIAVGLVGHLKKPHHEGAAGSADFDRRVLAYRPRVAAVQDLLMSLKHSNPSKIEAEAKNWSDDFAAGKLSALQPAAYEDRLGNSVRGEVLHAGLGLATSVVIHAEATMRQGHTTAAAEEAMVAAETAFGVRGFELESHIQASMTIRRTLNLLRQAWPQLPEAIRETYRARLKAMKMGEDETEKLANLEKQQLREYVQRMGIENLPADFSEAKQNAATDREQLASRRALTEHNSRLSKLIQS
jgi:hypothetical protein